MVTIIAGIWILNIFYGYIMRCELSYKTLNTKNIIIFFLFYFLFFLSFSIFPIW